MDQSGASNAAGSGLLEREGEIRALAAARSAAADARGGVVVIEGPPGIGKTALIERTVADARVEGFQVLVARGGELERDLPYGIVGQLVEPRLRAADAALLQRWTQGPAAAAVDALGLDPRRAPAPLGGHSGAADAVLSVGHGLYWLFAAMSESGPALLAVDDAHWADAPSLHCLAYLARRAADLQLVLVVGARTGWSGPGSPSDVIATSATRLRPEPLGPDGVRRFLIDRLDGAPDAGLVAACRAVTGGNPFLLDELVRALVADRLHLAGDAARRVTALAPEAIARAALARAAAVSPAAARLARCAAVVGFEGALSHVAEMAQLDLETASRARDELVAAHVLSPGPSIRFTHPIVRTAMYEELPYGERAAGHRIMARRLRAEGAAPEQVAFHLLATEPAGDAQVVADLRTAAQRDLERGVPDAAVDLLRRALAEPPPPDERADVLLELGAAEAASARAEAVEHLRAAVEILGDGERGARARARLAGCLGGLGRDREAMVVLEEALGCVDGHGSDLETELKVHLLAIAEFNPQQHRRVERELARLGAHPGSPRTRPERERVALLAQAAAMRAEPAELVVRLAAAALAGPAAAPRDWFASSLYTYAVDALTLAGRPADAGMALEPLRRPDLDHQIFVRRRVTISRLLIAEHTGQVADVELEAQTLARITGDESHRRGPMAQWAAGHLTVALLERGDEGAARAALAAADDRADAAAPMTAALVWMARGRLALATGRAAEAAQHFLQAGRMVASSGVTTSAIVPWRALAAEATALAGEPEAARRLAEEDVHVARRAGAPRSIGMALRALGAASAGAERIQHLEAAVEVLEQGPDRLELARALLDLGAALRRDRAQMAARDPLRRALDLAHGCRAAMLADRAREELLAAGARPRRPMLTGVDALTPSERRVAQLAAEGRTNREIAQILYVSRKTVETHLGRAYMKLGIGDRALLADALADSDEAAAAPGERR